MGRAASRSASLARTFLEQQAIHRPGLVGTPAVPKVTEVMIDAVVAGFERRFRSHPIDLFGSAGVRLVGAGG